MTPVKIIEKKQHGQKLSKPELENFVNGYIDGAIPDYQMSAFLMAVYFSGMDIEETVHLTEIMIDSGERIDFSDVPGKRVDKHSTGGVGDKLSLIIAPVVAACGGMVPMISGRGLGHTGGTLDKLESIPGFSFKMSPSELKEQTVKLGAALAGQGDSLVPADKKIYALRDVTSTVRSIPLITSSIISKKAAEGIDVLILDVKTGGGAFFPFNSDMESLANTLVQVGTGFGIKTIAVMTEMDQPLGHAVGNWLEVKECIDIMTGETRIDDVSELSALFSGLMLAESGICGTVSEGISIAESAIKNGSAFEKFLSIIEYQGGDLEFLKHPEKYERSKYSFELKASRSGYLERINTRGIGEWAIILGAGRRKIDDLIDHKAGLVFHKKCGQEVTADETIVEIFTDNEEALSRAIPAADLFCKISDSPPAPRPLIHKVISENGECDWTGFIK